MYPADWRHDKDFDMGSDSDGRRLYFGGQGYEPDLVKNEYFNMGVLISEVLMFNSGDARIDDDAILYREKNSETGEFVFITFGDVRDAIVDMKRSKGLSVDKG